MSRILWVGLIVLAVQVSCNIDPNTIPFFQTNLSLSLPVFKPQTPLPILPWMTDLKEINKHLVTSPNFVAKYTVTTKETSQQILPQGFPATTIYAYGGDCYDSISGDLLGQVFSWPGPTFLLHKFGKAEATWVNNLTGKHMFTIQENLHYMKSGINFSQFIPTVAHQHGLVNAPKFDGIPEAWFTSDGLQGDDYYTLEHPELRNQSTIELTNQQEEATLLYHDHSIGMTRLNFYAGLVGSLVIQDFDTFLSRTFDKQHDIFLSISERSFNDDGSLFYPSAGPASDTPNWVPFFAGDIMTVNGKAYPNLNVQRNLYRVRLMNVCNGRLLNLSFWSEDLGAPIPFKLYKTDSSYLHKPVQLTHVQLPAAGRLQLVMDFTSIADKRVIMVNIPQWWEANTPINAGTVAASTRSTINTGLSPGSSDQIMSFSPNLPVTKLIVLPQVAPILNPLLVEFPLPSTSVERRDYTLYEVVTANYIGAFINGATMASSSDTFELGKVYDLWLINISDFPHPMHIHLVNFQMYKRAKLNKQNYTNDWFAANTGTPPYTSVVNVLKPEPYLTDPWEMLDIGENRTWRDVTQFISGYVSVMRIKFTHNNNKQFEPEVKEGRFVLHCHILEHEDNEMMRYFTVV